jgi:tetratricopeptide (TPR) repeat protein
MKRWVFPLILLWIAVPVAVADDAAMKQAEIEKKVAELTAKLGDPEFEVRDEARDQLYKLGKPAVPFLKKASEERRKSGKEEDVKIADRIDKVVREIEKKQIVEMLQKFIPAGIENPGHFDRDFKEVLAVEGAVPTLKDIFADEEQTQTIRGFAADALVQAGDKSVIPDLKKIATDDIESENIRQSAAATCWLLGEKKPMDDMIAEAEKRAADGKDEPVRALQALSRLANLHYSIKQYDKAAEAYNQIETAMKDETRYAKSRERGFTQYNLACCLSLGKRVDEALKALETSLQCGYNEWKWLEIDGDLNNVRSDPRFAELVKKYKDKGPEDDKDKEKKEGGGDK